MDWRIPVMIGRVELRHGLAGWLLLFLAGCWHGENYLPVAQAGEDKKVSVGEQVFLDGSDSFDVDGDTMTYHWEMNVQPDGSKSALQFAETLTPFFLADTAGTYIISLVVNDGTGNSKPDTVRIEAENNTAGADAKDFVHPKVVAVCVACHDGMVATGKPADHYSSSDDCAACHDANFWSPRIAVDHGQVLGECGSCHKGGPLAQGKGSGHLVTSAPCNTCHLSASWAEVLGAGSSAGSNSGKTAAHIPSSNRCEVCHTAGTGAAVTRVDHNEVIGVCEACHNGTIAHGKTVVHLATNRQCNVCHLTSAWVPALTPAQIVEKPANHLLTSNVCDACHDAASWSPVARVDHTQVMGTCLSCHNDVVATGKSATHLPTTDVCDACHGVSVWNPVLRVDHAQVIGTCSVCHSLPGGHLVISEECDVCHTTQSWPGGLVVDHSSFSGNCVTCHDGTMASGKSASHIHSSDACDACHDKFPGRWTPVPINRVDHTQVVGVCSSCHNGVVAAGKSVAHVATTEECNVCHLTTTWLTR